MKPTNSKEDYEELVKAWNDLKRIIFTETLLGKIIEHTLNVLLKICNKIEKIRRTLWK